MDNKLICNCYFNIVYTENTTKNGYGIHGYIFNNETTKQGTGCKKACITKEGYDSSENAVKEKINVINYIDGFGYFENISNLFDASLFTINEILNKLIENKIFNINLFNNDKSICKLFYKIIIDKNVELINSVFSNQDYKNQLLNYLEIIKSNEGEIKINFISQETNLGIILSNNNVKRSINAESNNKKIKCFNLSSNKGYWDRGLEMNKIFSHPNYYFNPSIDNSVRNGEYFVYYLGDPRDKLQFLGKKIPDATFCVLYRKEKEPVIENIRKSINESNVDNNRIPRNIYIGYLDRIASKEIYNDIYDYGDTYLTKDSLRQRISYIDQTVISEEIKPPRLAFTAVEMLTTLEMLLNSFIDKTKNRIIETDITNLIYDVDKDKNIKIKSEITNALKSIDVDVNYKNHNEIISKTKITLTLSQDLPTRNLLSRLAETNVNVYVITWFESNISLRHSVIIKSNDDYSIWSGVYSNLHFLNPSN